MPHVHTHYILSTNHHTKSVHTSPVTSNNNNTDTYNNNMHVYNTHVEKQQEIYTKHDNIYNKRAQSWHGLALNRRMTSDIGIIYSCMCI